MDGLAGLKENSQGSDDDFSFVYFLSNVRYDTASVFLASERGRSSLVYTTAKIEQPDALPERPIPLAALLFPAVRAYRKRILSLRVVSRNSAVLFT